MNVICKGIRRPGMKGRLDYCRHCKKKTKTYMEDYYDDLFCDKCKFIKGIL